MRKKKVLEDEMVPLEGEEVMDVCDAMEQNRNKFLGMREPVILETLSIFVSPGNLESCGGWMKVTRTNDVSEIPLYNLVEPGEVLLELSNEI